MKEARYAEDAERLIIVDSERLTQQPAGKDGQEQQFSMASGTAPIAD